LLSRFHHNLKYIISLLKKYLQIKAIDSFNDEVYYKQTQWPKEKVQKDKQRSTKHTYKTKDRVTRTPLKTGDELRNNSTNIRKRRATTSQLKIYSSTYGVGNPCPALRQPQKVDGAKNINEIP
jgi:hypothetical protein